jgi:hypothetical protein
MSACAKRFQQETVKAAVAALQGGNPLRRFLVADEVGLGKTIVARDTLAKMVELAATTGRRRLFVVYYITSGRKIADQNKADLLRFLGSEEAKSALSTVDRLGLVASEPKTSSRLRLYAFTPATSFPEKERLSGGKAQERAFIGELLEAVYPGLRGQLPNGYLEHGATSGWPSAGKIAVTQMKNVTRAFVDAYRGALRAEFGTPTRSKIVSAAEKGIPRVSLGRMRKALAHAALEAAPPDLVIFDEFQRYRGLLNPDEGNPLAGRLLRGAAGRPAPPMLLLSATPYRFYAERWEVAAGVQPHAELFDLIGFLGGAVARRKAEDLFGRFGNLLHTVGRLPQSEAGGPIADAHAVKTALEGLLRPLMSRTERSMVSQPGTAEPQPAPLVPYDLDVYSHFVKAVKAAKAKHAGSAIAYWLSVPLPAQALGDRYQISRGVEFPASSEALPLRAATWARPPRDGWGSAKLRSLNALVPPESLSLPWVLPSLKWWAPGGAWAKAPQSPKMLLFSRFRATPQSVAALASLEVERRHAEKPSLSYAKAWKKRHLNPKANQGPTLALFHPSPFLIQAANPLDAGEQATLRQIRGRVRRQIIAALPPSIAPKAPNARQDRRSKPAWAVLAAIERERHKEFAQSQRVWSRLARGDATLQSLVKKRADVDSIRWISKGELDALVDMALGAPGVVTGRALHRHLPQLFDFGEKHFERLVSFCWFRLRPYLDRPVFWSVLPGDDAAAKYQKASIDGCLEAVLDEHFWLRKSKVNPEGLVEDLATALSANVGTFGFKTSGSKDKIRIRCHAAVPFGGAERDKSDREVDVGRGRNRRPDTDEPPPARSEEVRSAFNTPFWPHILATTSVGQEGLDFHSWCDQLGHWDLCSSPVDLEQREGRIQRFGGLSVRRPIARALGKDALRRARAEGASPWDIMARQADVTFGDESGLSPWWTMPDAALNNHLFALPQSRDLDRFERLRNQRLLYRLALGQPNPEDLVDLLSDHEAASGDALKALTLDLSAFSCTHREGRTTSTPVCPETPLCPQNGVSGLSQRED